MRELISYIKMKQNAAAMHTPSSPSSSSSSSSSSLLDGGSHMGATTGETRGNVNNEIGMKNVPLVCNTSYIPFYGLDLNVL